jgi:hypothetical protein
MILFMEGINSNAPQEFIDYTLCKEMGWTYRDLMEQPSSFVKKMLDVIKLVKKQQTKNG